MRISATSKNDNNGYDDDGHNGPWLDMVLEEEGVQDYDENTLPTNRTRETGRFYRTTSSTACGPFRRWIDIEHMYPLTHQR